MNVPVGAALWSAFVFRIGQSAVGVIVSLALARVAAGDRGTSAAVVGMLLSTNFAVELVAAPIFGGLSDRFGRKPFMVAGPLLGFLASQIYPATSALAPLFLARGLEGACAGSLTPSSLGFLSDATTTTLERRGRTMAYFEIATLLGIGVGYALGGVLHQALGPHAFRVASAAYLLSAVARCCCRKRPPPRHLACGPRSPATSMPRRSRPSYGWRPRGWPRPGCSACGLPTRSTSCRPLAVPVRR